MLPFEIVSDNYSFNQTETAADFKKRAAELGMRWNVDSNPKRKVLIERAFKKLGDEFFKEYPGYIGQGVKTKEKNGRTQQELLDIQQKPENQMKLGQIIAITHEIIDKYNNTAFKNLNDSPNKSVRKERQAERYSN